MSNSTSLYRIIFGFAFLMVFLLSSCSHEVQLGKKTDTASYSGRYIASISGEMDSMSGIDLNSDDSYQKFVSADVTYEKRDYAPVDLISLKEIEFIESPENASLRSEAVQALQELSSAFSGIFQKKMIIVSAYRSFDYQQGIEINAPQCVKDRFCAQAGHSEHQSGLAFDIFETTNESTFLGNQEYKKYFEWLSLHAHEYGFINSYAKGLEIDGYHQEPWHWRFVGTDLAQKLHENNMSFSEYYRAQNLELRK